MQRPDAYFQTRIREYENPTFGYRLGEDGEIEKEIFDGEPSEGWYDSPADVPRYASPAAPPAAPAPVPEPALPVGGGIEITAPYGKHKFNDLRAELVRRTAKGPPVGTNKIDLIAMLEDLDAAAMSE